MKFTFKVVAGNLYEHDSKGNMVHYKDSKGYEIWRDYDSNGRLIHNKHSDGYEVWYNSKRKLIHTKNPDGYEYEYDFEGNLVHHKNPEGVEYWYSSKGKAITKQEFEDSKNSIVEDSIVEIAGIKYKLTKA